MEKGIETIQERVNASCKERKSILTFKTLSSYYIAILSLKVPISLY